MRSSSSTPTEPTRSTSSWASYPVPLYAAPETGVLYGATSAASYLVKPNGSAATVIVASIGRSDVREAKLDGKVWTCGNPEPPCKQLVACMEGAELDYCTPHAEACVWQDGRSQFATRLEHEGSPWACASSTRARTTASTRAARSRCAAGACCSCRASSGRAWPRGTTFVVNPDEARVLKAGYDSEKRAWVVGMPDTAPGDPKAKEFPWWLIGAIVGAIVLFGLSALLRALLR